ncbi:MAG: NAD(P)-dependent oxidoreductase [Solirubrobacterales bacterium]|jgi:3-hydroxyisobutyrate dehydrogenase-like beta-hydroxyacid dehydrogenase|nr:NAD(P)-dependent oxidoreductase [Solirubrobacterales bacterium]
MDRIGFLGLGIMGSRMAANLAAAGHPLTVWTRTEGKAQAWAAEREGADAVATPAEVAAACDVLITMLVDGDQVAGVVGGPDGLASAGGSGKLLVDMSTIGPAAAREVAAALPAGWSFLDAPVTGSSPRAEDGTLTIMAGGAAVDVARARPLFEVMGTLVLHVGGTGQGQMVKLINNATAAVNAGTVAQALLVGAATGVDLDALVQVMGAGSGASLMLDLKAAPMRAHAYDTLFKLEHMLKDVRLCLEEADRAGVPFPAAAATRDALVAARGRGHGDDDFAAILEAYEGLAGRRLGEARRTT